MSAIEESLRRALENGSAGDPAFRQSIYAASERAMERMIVSRQLDEVAAEEQRLHLQDTIDRVEAEYAAYGDGPDAYDGDPAMAEAGEDWIHEADETVREPGSFDPGDAPAPAQADPLWTPGAGRQTGGPARGLPRLLLTVAIAAIVLGLIVYAVARLFAPDAQSPSNADPEPAAAVETEPSTDSASLPPAEDLVWIDVFSGDDLALLSSPSGGRMEADATQARAAVRIAAPGESTGNPADGEVLLTIGPGVVGEIADETVRVEMVVGSPDGNPREFAVRCVFADLSVCDRQRFLTAMGEEAFVFDVAIPAEATSPATLAIAPGLGEGGPDLDLFSVRLRVL